jgi:hypothetical protein
MPVYCGTACDIARGVADSRSMIEEVALAARHALAATRRIGTHSL